ncbi:hypothetical protein FRC11_008226 [Ceratobasidium sp. 423]|nr:hypothetical protein FRC11_008226 [Ceratobasidium sp. 423]
MILDTITPKPSLITPFDREKGLDHPAPVPKHDREATRPRKPTGHEHVPAPPPKGPGDSTITPEDIQELRTLIVSGKVLTFADGDKYEAAVFTGNLLYVRKAPGAVVITHIIEEVQATVKFARKNNIQLTVKNGGHSYAGYSLNYGGILLDMGQFTDVILNLEGEVKTAMIQGGCRWHYIYDMFKGEEAFDNTYMVIGGQCPAVGVSGFTLGGGLSPFSRTYGLGIDSVLEMNIVTAAGELVTVNHQDTDPKKKGLFWAMRGGGGGNFGILVDFTTRVHKLNNPGGIVACGALTWELPRQRSEFEAMMKVFNTTDWPKELTMDAIWRYEKTKSGDQPILLAQLTVIYNGTEEDFRKVTEPLTRFGCTSNVKSMRWHDWVVIDEGFTKNSPVYHHHASFVFAEGGITPAVVSAIVELMGESYQLLQKYDREGKSHVLWDHIGGQTTQVGPKDTAFFWRDGFYVSNFKIQWTHPGIADKMFAFVAKVKETLLPHTIQGKAAYVNYIDSTVANWQEAYYGDNYPTLQQIKKDWDPDNFFHFEQSVELPGAKGPDTGTGKDLENAIRKTRIIWDRYSLPNPDTIWNLEEPTEQNVLRAVREQVAP